MPEDAKRILDSVIQLWNTGDSEVAKKLYSDNARRYDPNQPEPGRGPQEISRYIAEVRTAYPDFHLEINESVQEGNLLVSHWTCTGTHRGKFLGMPPTGRGITIRGLTLGRIEDGKITEEYVYFDRLTMLEQLGLASNVGHRSAQ
ncbi:MAG TPA: ester cyclase [Bryobacteraceae bacterium]|nr:ester cyclase [Bryobacteraceae bacterium]